MASCSDHQVDSVHHAPVCKKKKLLEVNINGETGQHHVHCQQERFFVMCLCCVHADKFATSQGLNVEHNSRQPDKTNVVQMMMKVRVQKREKPFNSIQSPSIQFNFKLFERLPPFADPIHLFTEVP